MRLNDWRYSLYSLSHRDAMMPPGRVPSEYVSKIMAAGAILHHRAVTRRQIIASVMAVLDDLLTAVRPGHDPSADDGQLEEAGRALTLSLMILGRERSY